MIKGMDKIKWEGAGKYEFSLVKKCFVMGKLQESCMVLSEWVKSEEQLRKAIDDLAFYYDAEELDYCMRTSVMEV